MNYKEWFSRYEENYPSSIDIGTRIDGKIAWDACKKEVLKILEENIDYLYDCNGQHIKEQIEKL